MDRPRSADSTLVAGGGKAWIGCGQAPGAASSFSSAFGRLSTALVAAPRNVVDGPPLALPEISGGAVVGLAKSLQNDVLGKYAKIAPEEVGQSFSVAFGKIAATPAPGDLSSTLPVAAAATGKSCSRSCGLTRSSTTVGPDGTTA